MRVPYWLGRVAGWINNLINNRSRVLLDLELRGRVGWTLREAEAYGDDELRSADKNCQPKDVPERSRSP